MELLRDISWARVDPPTGQATGWGGILPSQELVDCYEFTDGKPGNDPSHANDPYIDRDKRFYATIIYNGASWRGGKYGQKIIQV